LLERPQWGDWIARGKTTDSDAYSYLSDRVPFSSRAIMLFNEPNHRCLSAPPLSAVLITIVVLMIALEAVIFVMVLVVMQWAVMW
jgi:hypothetical protein